MTKNVIEVYQSFIWLGKHTELAERLYDRPPVTLQEVIDRAGALRQRYLATDWFSEELISRVKRVLSRINRELGGLSPRVRRNIERLYEGVVEAGHQTVCMGGPAYILNKAATTSVISKIASENNVELAPLFFVADYDVVQPELTNVRTPLLGPDGNLISMPVPNDYKYSPVCEIPLPVYDWYLEAEESIRTGYRPLFGVLKGTERELFEERLEHALAITREAFLHSGTLGQWAARVMSHLFNVEGDLGVPLFVYSNDELRELCQLGMETLLARPTRDNLVKTHGLVTQMIVDEGLDPGMGARSEDYVPFFYECFNRNCHRARFELHYQTNTTTELTGRCPSCGQHFSIEINPTSPDLSDVVHQLSPRVDSRQLIVDTVIPIVCHVGGTSEAGYYAQVIPLAREIQIPFPMFIKYPRVYFNTPWNESLSKRLQERRVPVLQSPELFKLIGQIAKCRKGGDPNCINSYVMQLENLIGMRHDELVTKHAELQASLHDHITTEDLQLKFDIECYRSWAYGEYEQGKSGQEVTWSCIEWAINSGLSDLFGPYQRAYSAALRNGSTQFVNFVV